MPSRRAEKSGAPAGEPVPSAADKKKALLDELIMGTNSSSITSKRSVEKLYYPEEEHYFRYFVPRFQRRSPLVNRGYWFRLRAIDVSVREFLRRDCGARKKVVVNLGCGSDVLPWQCEEKYADLSPAATFIDVDYPDMMHKKKQIVMQIPELAKLLGDSFKATERATGVILESPKYSQIACDLRELDAVTKMIQEVVDLNDSHVLFVAEVSITYMDNKSADNVVQWASTIPSAEFCLLEQILPDGPRHPFAQNMLAHFDKLQTSLKSVYRYPTMSHQEERFKTLGWAYSRAWNLWEAWGDSFFMSAEDRAQLDHVEPFDEWEEFAVFGTHYTIVHASNVAPIDYVDAKRHNMYEAESTPSLEIDVGFLTAAGPHIHRRHGGAVAIEADGGDAIASFFGQGVTNRSPSVDVYSFQPVLDPGWAGPAPRVCFSTTDLGSCVLLAGGRASPARAMSDTWILDKKKNSWSKGVPLPQTLYRHSVTRLGTSSLALLVGGKMGATEISDGIYIYIDQGWSKCQALGTVPAPRFGAALGSFSEAHGFLSGGITASGLVDESTYRWHLDLEQKTIRFVQVQCDAGLARFGALAIPLSSGSVVLVGGIVGNHLIPTRSDILLISEETEAKAGCLQSTETAGILVRCLRDEKLTGDCPHRPFFIGSGGVERNGEVVVIGGGATCYAMGSYWSPGQYSFRIQGEAKAPRPLVGSFEIIGQQ
ncbi:hypothetical protein BROUX41_006701 [Berkeleyomyces rouxiae]